MISFRNLYHLFYFLGAGTRRAFLRKWSGAKRGSGGGDWDYHTSSGPADHEVEHHHRQVLVSRLIFWFSVYQFLNAQLKCCKQMFSVHVTLDIPRKWLKWALRSEFPFTKSFSLQRTKTCTSTCSSWWRTRRRSSRRSRPSPRPSRAWRNASGQGRNVGRRNASEVAAAARTAASARTRTSPERTDDNGISNCIKQNPMITILAFFLYNTLYKLLLRSTWTALWR